MWGGGGGGGYKYEHIYLSKQCKITYVLITLMEICKAPTLRLKALKKHSITHIMYIEMEMLSAVKMYIRKETKKS